MAAFPHSSIGVLVIEDDHLFADYLRVLLEDLGYRILGVTDDGAHAVELAIALKPSIVLTDIILAGALDGIDVANRIRAQYDVPVLFLTAVEDPSIFRRAAIADPSAYLLKPFNERELQFAIELALHRHRLTIESQKAQDARYEGLFRVNPNPMMVCERSSLAVIDINDAALLHYGYSHESFLSLTYPALCADQAAVSAEDLLSRPKEYVESHMLSAGDIIQVQVACHAIEYGGRAALLVLINDVTDRLRAEARLVIAHQRLLALSGELLRVQEEERRILARELHDEIGQSLSALKIALHTIGLQIEFASEQAKFKLAIEIADATLAQVRQMSLDLRPPQLDDLGLPAAIRWNLERQCTLAQLTANFATEGVPARLPEPIAIACYRISQEAITNVIRHADARHIRVALEIEANRLQLEVHDDGCGFDPARVATGTASMGIASMEERAQIAGGWLTIESAPGSGTMVRAGFPLTNMAQKQSD